MIKNIILLIMVLSSLPDFVLDCDQCRRHRRSVCGPRQGVNFLRKHSNAGANPTIVICNAVVNFYNATGSLACFENKNILFYFVKRSSLLQRWRCSGKLKKIVGLAPDVKIN
jgi:hypothetical protein